MQDPYLPMGCSDNDDYFRDDTEPDVDTTHDGERLLVTPYGPIDWVQCDPCGDMVDRALTYTGYAFGLETLACDKCRGYDYDPADLRGTTFPSNPTEAASFAYEIAHWR